MARRKKPQRPNVTRDRLRTIREATDAQTAADAAGIPKRIRVENPNNPSGYGYRTLTKKQRRDRLQIRITGYSRGSKTPGGPSERVRPANIEKGLRKRIKDNLGAIPLEDRVKAGFRIQSKDRLKELNEEIRDLESGQEILSQTAREEYSAAQQPLRDEADDIRQSLRDNTDQEVWEAYEAAVDGEGPWDEFRDKYSSQ